MGTGAEAWIVPAVIAAAGTAVQVQTTRRAQADQNAAMAAGMQDTREKQKEADKRVDQEIGALETSDAEDERKASMDRFMEVLRNAKRSTSGDVSMPGASDRYGEDVAMSQAGIQNFGEQVAGTLSRINGQTQQRMTEARGFDRAATDIGGIAKDADTAMYLARLRAGGISPNAWAQAAGQLATGVGTGMASRASVPNAPVLRNGAYAPNTNARTWGGGTTIPNASPPPR